MLYLNRGIYDIYPSSFKIDICFPCLAQPLDRVNVAVFRCKYQRGVIILSKIEVEKK